MTIDRRLPDPLEGAASLDARPLRPSRVRYLVLAAACGLAVVAYLHRVGFASASTELKTDLGLNSQELGYLYAAFLLAYGGFEVPCGLLVDRLGVRHVLTVLVVAWSLLTAGVALVGLLPLAPAWQFSFLLALRFFFGMAQAGGFPALSRMMTDWMTIRERASAQGLIWMASRLGGTFVPLLLYGLAHFWGGWRLPLVGVAALGIVWCAAFWPWFRNGPEDMAAVNDAETALIAAGRPAQASGHGPAPWGRMLGSLNVWALCLMYGCDGFSATFYITLLPDYLRYHRHLSEGATKWLTSLPLLCGALACVLGGFYSDWLIRATGNRKWGRRFNGAVGLTCAGLALLGTVGVHDVRALGFLLCLAFFFNDLAMGPAWAACADIGERYAGTLGGAMNMVGNLAAALGALVAGNLFKHGASSQVFVLFALSYALGSLCWLGVDVTKPLAVKP